MVQLMVKFEHFVVKGTMCAMQPKILINNIIVVLIYSFKPNVNNIHENEKKGRGHFLQNDWILMTNKSRKFSN